ncbi:hypothetical protein N665_0467s0006 [Sinapis alba]|nr:hypothetical protein N665_0467s0006 [Sinapis alba]
MTTTTRRKRFDNTDCGRAVSDWSCGLRGQEKQKHKQNNRFQYWGEHFASCKLYHFPLMEKEAEAISSNFKAYCKRQTLGDMKTEALELPLMDFEAIAITTNNFSNTNKLGKGGFGIVYKGMLLGGKQIAVKTLSKMSLQGTYEFENEVGLIANLQHIKFVRLLGYCVDKEEKMLIYEYLENLSLDSHLFDKSRCAKLNWQLRFGITNGIARGLLYLHQDSRFRITHRDLKVSNVLLDKNMIPKISDFGMTRIFGREETKANTQKVVGTYGYMAPEYAMNRIFSVNSDVFSYGTLLLEIISGKTNSSSSSSTLKTHEILRYIHVGLLCVQKRVEDRPEMSYVMVMLGSETTTLLEPKQPVFYVGRGPLEPELSKQGDDEWTVNQITLSVIDARLQLHTIFTPHIISGTTEYLELPLIDFEAITIAISNFSNTKKLGKSGFGIVYKEMLLGGKEIAVKRLSKISLQETYEFENEVGLNAKLQHINLVRLLGYCVDKEEKMLIYEYLENLSLDSHLFEQSQCAKLNWQLRFGIGNGIARGLLYLHQDSRLRIIHRDLKVSYVLLDKNMITKISDFGMARIFGRDETKANTRKVVGTY